MTVRIGIVGYGNLGQGVESAIQQNKDMRWSVFLPVVILPP